MRLDKFLKTSRLIKRRTVAKDVAEAERVLINGKVSKPSSNVNVNDIITIQFGNKIVSIKVLLLSESTKKEDSKQMFEIISEEIK